MGAAYRNLRGNFKLVTKSELNSSRFGKWILATRPKTLAAAIAPIIAATSLAHSSGYSISLKVSFLCFLCAALIQIATNYINDGADFESGADTKDRLGPKRAAMLGILTPKQLYVGAGLALALAFFIGVYLTSIGGGGIFVIGLLSLLFAVLYTKGPFPLAYNGLGDLFVLIFFGLIAVNGVYYLQTTAVTINSVVLGIIIGLAALLIMVSNNTRDIPTDTKAGKWTISALIGEKLSKVYFAVVVMLIPLLMATLFYLQLEERGHVFVMPPPIALFLVVFFFVTGLLMARDFFHARSGDNYNNLLERSAKHLLAVSIATSLCLVAFRWGYV